MARITLQTPDGQSFEAELTGDLMTVGRGDENDLAIPDGSVSTNHGQFTNEGGQWVFTDLGSTNGTKANGQRVERVELGHGAAFEMGNVLVTFYEEQAAAAPVTTAPRTSTAAAGGYGTTPIDRAARTGFGPHKKEKDGPRSMILMLGFVGLLAALGIAALLLKGGVGN